MLNRRKFLKVSGVCGAGLALPGGAMAGALHVDDPLRAYPSREWEEQYRKELAATRGDSEGFAFHCSNCQGNCAWRTGAQGGMIVREEQLAQYPQINPDIPDANPRGCNKGIIHSQAMYEKDRLLYPLKRAGKRGEGKWERVTWDRALEEIAAKVVEVIQKHGPGGLMIHAGTGILSQGKRAGPLRLGSLLGAIRLYPSSAVGDMFTGASVAYGVPNVGHSLDAWFEMDYILLWGINPSVTRIPDAHYLWEGRYRGARIVTIAPDYNPTSIHADMWVPVNPGTDSLLAMSLVNAAFEDKLYKEDFIKEQTDLPFLVRKDTGLLLRESDLRKDGSGDVFYFWDKKTNSLAEAPGSKGSKRDTLRLGGADPALEGTFTAQTRNGKVQVTTVFELARREAAKFSPEDTAERTGVPPAMARRIAREFAAAKKAGLTIGFSLHKYAWGILACWAQALFCALTGHAADTGGLDTESQWSLGGIGPLSNPKPARFASGFLSEWIAGGMDDSLKKHYGDKEFKARAGLDADALIKLSRESREKKWLAHYGEPKARIIFADNFFRRNKSAKNFKDTVLAATELLVAVNFRMDTSAESADYALPSFAHYEGWDIRGEVGYHRFANLVVPPPGLRPVGEAKSEWEICRLLAEKIEAAAKAGGVAKIPDPEFSVTVDGAQTAVTRDMDTLGADFTMGGRIATDKDVTRWLVENDPAFQPWKFEDAAARGFITLNREAGLTSPLYASKPYHSFEEQVYLRRPYPTLSGRQQFYVDHPLFLKLGAAVPTAREPLHPSRFPLKFYSPHTRWGIHSTWRTNKYMLRMQRGEPHVLLNASDAAKRGVSDGARIRVFNDVGEFFALAKIGAGVRPGSLVMEHAWEPHQFKGRAGLNSVVAGLLSPLELAGGWGHLKFGPEWDGNQLALESSVEVALAQASAGDT
ncbi:MAG: molybdopterin-dependent oxidoreductase [Nitrospinae bacterium]|nr:molybdopterin-dependent oxidoreductase [Nitrospinota bacterium]